jgi:hypothetical protein
MITVSIAGECRQLEDASESWITQKIERRRRDGMTVCVQVAIQLSGLMMTLSTPGCGAAGGGGRLPNDNEREVFALWDKLGLNRSDFAPGNLIAFLKQFRRLAAA